MSDDIYGAKGSIKYYFSLSICVLFAGLAPQGLASTGKDKVVTDTYSIESKDAREMARLRNLVKDEVPFPIVILNRQALQVNLAIQKRRHPGIPEHRLKSEIVQAEVKKQSGLQLHPGLGESYYNEIESNLELAMIHGYDYSRFSISDDTTGKFCMLYPGRRDLDNERLSRFVTDFRPESYQSLAQLKLKPILSRQEHIHLADLHEFSHCIDDHYFVEYLEGRVKGSGPYFENRARIELKAEVLGILLMTKYEGAKDLARRRSQERYLDSWFRGRNVAVSSGDETGLYSGATYAFGPALEHLQNEIDRLGPARLQQFSTSELIGLAERVVEAAVLDFSQMTALTEAYLNPERALTRSPQSDFIKNYLGKVADSLLAVTQSGLNKKQVIETIIQNKSVPNSTIISFPEVDAMDEATTRRVLRDIAPYFHEVRQLDHLLTRLGKIEDNLAQQIESSQEHERVQAMQQYRVLPQAFAQALEQLALAN